MGCKIYRTEGVIRAAAESVQLPILTLPFGVSAIWIDPASEVQEVFVQAGNLQNSYLNPDGTGAVTGITSNVTTPSANLVIQPWRSPNNPRGVIVGVGAPLVCDLQPQIVVYGFPNFGVNPRYALGYAVGGVPDSLPQLRAMIQAMAQGSGAALNPLKLRVPVYGRPKITIAVTNNDGANAASTKLLAGVDQDNTASFTALSAAKATVASGKDIFDFTDFFPSNPRVDWIEVQMSGPTTNAAVLVQARDTL